jgi:hypothetical protein
MCLTIKFANSPPCACRSRDGQKPQYGLMTLEYKCFTAVLLLIYGSLFPSGVYYCLSVFWCAVANNSWILHQDNATAHMALSVREFLASKQITVLEHPPYSPDLIPNNFIRSRRQRKYWKEAILMTLMTSGVIRRQLWRPFHKSSSKIVFKGGPGTGIGA